MPVRTASEYVNYCVVKIQYTRHLYYVDWVNIPNSALQNVRTILVMCHVVKYVLTCYTCLEMKSLRLSISTIPELLLLTCWISWIESSWFIKWWNQLVVWSAEYDSDNIRVQLPSSIIMYVCLSVQLCWPYRSVAQNIEHSLNTYYIARTVFDLNKRARNDLTLSIIYLAEQTTRYLESVLKSQLNKYLMQIKHPQLDIWSVFTRMLSRTKLKTCYV